MIEKLILPFSLLSDPDGAAAQSYRVWDEKEQIAIPAVFVVDAEGVVRYAYVGQDFADRPADDELVAALKGGLS
jgi:peroxiredoxin